MAVEERETVVVNEDRRSPYGWLIAVGIIILLVILFFVLGGANLFNGAGGGDTINVDAPDNVQVQPAN